VTQQDAFQEKFRRLGVLVEELDAVSGGCSAESCRELIQLLMDVHGTALQRVLQIVSEGGASGEVMISKAGEDPIVRPLLVLYSLHPESLETRVLKALDGVRQSLRKLNCVAELLDACDGAVRVQVRIDGHACGSTTKTVRSIVEDSIYDFAPDLTSLEILEPQEQTSSGFVSIDSLLPHSTPVRPETELMQTTGAD